MIRLLEIQESTAEEMSLEPRGRRLEVPSDLTTLEFYQQMMADPLTAVTYPHTAKEHRCYHDETPVKGCQEDIIATVT